MITYAYTYLSSPKNNIILFQIWKITVNPTEGTYQWNRINSGWFLVQKPLCVYLSIFDFDKCLNVIIAIITKYM